jgi:FeS assembly SUF system regulator
VLRIGKITDYGIVVLVQMARTAHRCVHPATELADETGIPLPTVQKVLKMLAKDGLVVSMRGARGGYALAQDPAHTDLVRVLECLEGPLALTECAVPHTEACAEAGRCHVAPHWQVINDAVRTALEGVSVLQLARTRPAVVRPAARLAEGA